MDKLIFKTIIKELNNKLKLVSNTKTFIYYGENIPMKEDKLPEIYQYHNKIYIYYNINHIELYSNCIDNNEYLSELIKLEHDILKIPTIKKGNKEKINEIINGILSPIHFENKRILNGYVAYIIKSVINKINIHDDSVVVFQLIDIINEYIILLYRDFVEDDSDYYNGQVNITYVDNPPKVISIDYVTTNTKLEIATDDGVNIKFNNENENLNYEYSFAKNGDEIVTINNIYTINLTEELILKSSIIDDSDEAFNEIVELLENCSKYLTNQLSIHMNNNYKKSHK